MSQVIPITENAISTKRALPEHLQTLKNTLTAEEYRICELQYREQPFARMTPDNIRGHAMGLLIKISIITGWTIPENEDIKRVLYDQFAKKIYENYGSLNVQEVEYAVRNYGTSVKDWGKSINISLIEEAVQPYLLKRSEIRKLEEAAMKPKELPEPVVPFDREKLVEDARFVFLKTRLVGLIPSEVYDILESEKEIDLSLEEKNKIKDQVERRLEAEAEQDGLRAVVDFRHFKKTFRKEYFLKVRTECKKQAAANYFRIQDEIDKF